MFTSADNLIATVAAAVFAVLFACAAIYGIFVKKRLDRTCDDAKETDALREELERSRKREIILRKKETDLVDSLAKELKDPVTGIKLTADLMKTKAAMDRGRVTDEAYINEKLDAIYEKADQIERSVKDLLSAALDDFGDHPVSCSDVESRILGDMVRKHDDRGLVTMAEAPNVLVHMDPRCMSRVIGNIISNSYQYAHTAIDVSFLLTDEYLQMKISDHGPGVGSDELEHITEQFYRGRMADEAGEGSGLGLYVAKTLTEKMNGGLVVENTQDGLSVTILVRLS